MRKPEYDAEGRRILDDMHRLFGWTHIQSVHTGLRYDVEGIDGDGFAKANETVFAEAPVDMALSNWEFEELFGNRCVLVEQLPGQYDQTADSAEQCIQLQTGKKPKVRVARVIVIKGGLTPEQASTFKKYVINPTDSREATRAHPDTLAQKLPEPSAVKTVDHFDSYDKESLKKEFGFDLAMTGNDLAKVKEYFAFKGRSPTVTELRVIDTYWSDHCRHTTFTTELTDIAIGGKTLVRNGKALKLESEPTDPTAKAVTKALGDFLADRETLFANEAGRRELSLMDMALFSMREARANGKLDDMEDSEENNAASVVVPVKFKNGKREDWLFMFKNETHNHPTEIEPYGGAATCIGGAIRDPLSGRTYVNIAMRLTGGGDPREPIGETMDGKLPQRTIAQQAQAGHAGYGDQIGVATLKTQSFYHPKYRAKRLETGFVGAGAKKENVIREAPEPGDLVILLGGRTGRDGIGGASGSSKEHTESSVTNCGAEVQKGNAPEERKLQRLFRNPEASMLTKRCNDFGAGGVAVAIGELADGMDIDLDKVPLKYDGLDGTEIAISESQERMAVLTRKEHVDAFLALADAENLEATVVSEIKEEKRLRMSWRGETICDIDRDFLNGGWSKREESVNMITSDKVAAFFSELPEGIAGASLSQKWISNLKRVNVASQRSQQEHFDSTVGANTVVGPFEGKTQTAPSEAVVARFPAEDAETSMVAAMGFDPYLSDESTFHGGMYAVVDSAARLVAAGADPSYVRLTFQNYFEKLGSDADRWGKVFLAQLGAREAQKHLGMPAIGGKDSMSGTFNSKGQRHDVPPTLASFAVSVMEEADAIPSCFQQAGSKIIYLQAPQDEANVPEWQAMMEQWKRVHHLQQEKKILSSHAVHAGGMAAALSQMSFGNTIGADIKDTFGNGLFAPLYGSMILEIPAGTDPSELFDGIPYAEIGKTTSGESIVVRSEGGISTMLISKLREEWEKPLDDVFPRSPSITQEAKDVTQEPYVFRATKPSRHAPVAQPRASVLAFPGTNCELETARAFERHGAVTDVPVFGNLTEKHIHDSIRRFAESIRNSNILALPGGFSAGDQPGGSAKFIANALRNTEMQDAIHDLVDRGGLVIGICNGFQGLLKSCLLPNGRIGVQTQNATTLTHNDNAHFTSRNVMHRVTSVLSPWMAEFEPGEFIDIPVAHGEGKLINLSADVWENGQVPFQYADRDGRLGMDHAANPNGSEWSAAALTDVSGRIFGMMAHPERALPGLQTSIPGERKGNKIFKAGVNYFR